MAGLSRLSVARPMLVEMAGSGPAMTMGGSAVAPFGALIPQRTLRPLELELRPVDITEPFQRIRAHGEAEARPVRRMHHAVLADVE
jgi:hypothetical protein